VIACRLSVTRVGVAALLVVPACRSVPRVTGSYELQAVNHQALPYEGAAVGGTWIEVTGGSVLLNPDGTFRRRLIYQAHTGDALHTDSTVQTGKYERRMSTVVMHVAGGDESADLAGPTLTMTIRGWSYLFRKPE
jgi:hypothetical protein